MAKKTSEALADANEARARRVREWMHVHGEMMVEGMCSAALLVLERGHVEAARQVYLEVTRRYEARVCSSATFHDLDAKLHAELTRLEESAQTVQDGA